MRRVYLIDELDVRENRKLSTSCLIINTLLICVIILNIYVFSIFGISNLRYNNFKLKEYIQEDYIYTRSIIIDEYHNYNKEYNITKEQGFRLVEDLVKPKAYILVHKTSLLYPEALGVTYLSIRAIIIKDNLSRDSYLITLTHEFIHLKYFVANETFTHFMTFKLLWESDNEYLHYLGAKLGKDILNHYYPGPYNCIGNIVEYFKIKEDI